MERRHGRRRIVTNALRGRRCPRLDLRRRRRLWLSGRREIQPRPPCARQPLSERRELRPTRPRGTGDMRPMRYWRRAQALTPLLPCDRKKDVSTRRQSRFCIALRSCRLQLTSGATHRRSHMMGRGAGYSTSTGVLTGLTAAVVGRPGILDGVRIEDGLARDVGPGPPEDASTTCFVHFVETCC